MTVALCPLQRATVSGGKEEDTVPRSEARITGSGKLDVLDVKKAPSSQSLNLPFLI